MRRIFLAVLSAVVGFSLASAAHGQDLQNIIERGEIVVGIDMTTPPWGRLDENQQPAGYGPALAQVLADSLGVNLRIEQVTGPSRIPTLLSGRADVIISTLSVTAERAAQVWFTNPYAGNPLVLVAPSATAYESYEDLVAGTRIAVPRGSPQDQSVSENAPDATILRFDDDAGAQQALISGQADLVGTGGMVPPVLNRMDPGKDYETKIVLQNLYMSMAVTPGASNLLQYLNTFIFLQKQNGKLDELSREYIEIPVGDLPSF